MEENKKVAQIGQKTPSLASVYRSHSCGELREANSGQSVTLSGWLHRKRDHGGILFCDLRDHYGITQIVVPVELADQLRNTRLESVILVQGSVVKRQGTTSNSRIPTGDVEVLINRVQVLATSEMVPFAIAEDDNAPEPTRLKYRFLELRRDKLHSNIILRSDVIAKIREVMLDLGFREFQTPIITASSPEGARDFLVPSRLHPGKFFALPQAPQQFKQLLMVAGFDRYFQIAPCFRDENPRADRSPGEFYQIDLEMSFVEQEDVFAVGERLLNQVFSAFTSKSVTGTPFPRITFKEALENYGTDKPDLRIPYRITDVTSVFEATDFRVFQKAVAEGGKVFAIPVSGTNVPSRKVFDEIVKYFTDLSGSGLGYLYWAGDGVKGSLAKTLSEQEIVEIERVVNAKESTLVFLAAGREDDIRPHVAKLRVKLGHVFNSVEEGFKFCWIVDFPMYEYDPDEKKIVFSHNPFSMPQGGLDALEEMRPLDILAYQYDIVCNGYELASGAIRNQLPEIMYKAFNIAGYSQEDVDQQFGGMIKAFTFGAPPHGGMAAGVDRIVMLLAEEEAIRDVIAFPLAQTGEDLLMGAPSVVSDKQLRDVHIKLK